MGTQTLSCLPWDWAYNGKEPKHSKSLSHPLVRELHLEGPRRGSCVTARKWENLEGGYNKACGHWRFWQKTLWGHNVVCDGW